jgi:hypothetical protein
MSCYIISIGGTGARVAEAMVHLAAAGLLGTDAVKVLFIDPDESNGNLKRTQDSLHIYQACRHSVVGEGAPNLPWLNAPFTAVGNWSPFGVALEGHKTLGDFFNYASYDESAGLKQLFDVLYTEQERKADLDVGFRGRPAIGAAVMSQVNLDRNDQEPWRSLLQQISMDLGMGKSPKIFLCGSIFGGTGASGFPTIGRLIYNLLLKNKLQGNVKLGGLLMLPYFQFSTPIQQTPNDIYAKPEQFLMNTQAALHYYKQQEIFDTIFLLGDQEPTSVGNFSLGKNTQNNDPHFIEFFGALATRAFFLGQATSKVVLLSRTQDQQISWSDVPDRETVKPALVTTTRFAWLWHNVISPELRQAQQSKRGLQDLLKFAPWSGHYFKLGRLDLLGGRGLPELTDDPEQNVLQLINTWCLDYLHWLGLMHRSGSGVRSIQLFNPQLLMNTQPSQSLAVDALQTLVLGEEGQGLAQQATVQSLKEKLDAIKPRRLGMIGLATELYTLCGQER